MRNVLKSSNEVLHFWANSVQPSGRSASVSFENEKLFSYRACIGKILPNGFVAFTTRSYSVTTSCHVSKARHAARHLKTVFCEYPGNSVSSNVEIAKRDIKTALDNADKPRIRQATKDKFKAQALSIADNCNAYILASGETCLIDTSNIEHIREAVNAFDAAVILERANADKKRYAESIKELAEWRKGDGSAWLYLPAIALRLKGEFVETSQCAEIPVSDALKLWPIIKRVMSGVKDYTPGAPIGNYRLTQIRTNGSIVVDCHDIAYSEIELISKELGL